jgi:hypothetical protein
MKKIIIILLVLLMLSLFLAENVPRDSLTRSAMIVARCYLVEFYQNNGVAPSSLVLLKNLDKERLLDGYGKTLHYSINDNIVTLSSQGEDGLLYCIFDITKPSLSPWIKEPSISVEEEH